MSITHQAIQELSEIAREVNQFEAEKLATFTRKYSPEQIHAALATNTRPARETVNLSNQVAAPTPPTTQPIGTVSGTLGKTTARQRTVRTRTGTRNRVPPEKAARIVEMFQAGTPKAEIVRKLGVSSGTVNNYIGKALGGEAGNGRQTAAQQAQTSQQLVAAGQGQPGVQAA